MTRRRETFITYVNYPSTEYRPLPFLYLVAFNLYLEEPAAVCSHLARLQNLAGEKPLVLAELGSDSVRSRRGKQARVLSEQPPSWRDAGCARDVRDLVDRRMASRG